MKAGEVFLSLKQVSESVYSYKPQCVVPPHLQYYCFHRLSFPSMAMLLNDVLYLITQYGSTVYIGIAMVYSH